MTVVCDRFTVFLDANVLYPVRKRDVLLRFGEAGLFRPRWSNEVLAEWKTALMRKKPHLEKSIDSQIAAMNNAFPEAIIGNHLPLVSSLTLPDPEDRHVLAAAIKADAQHIITENLKDFPNATLTPWGIEAVGADPFLESTFELYPQAAVAAIAEMRRDYINPKFSREDFLLELTRAGMPRLSNQLKSAIDTI